MTKPIGLVAALPADVGDREMLVPDVSGGQYIATGFPGDPVAPFIFNGDHTNKNS